MVGYPEARAPRIPLQSRIHFSAVHFRSFGISSLGAKSDNHVGTCSVPTSPMHPCRGLIFGVFGAVLVPRGLRERRQFRQRRLQQSVQLSEPGRRRTEGPVEVSSRSLLGVHQCRVPGFRSLAGEPLGGGAVVRAIREDDRGASWSLHNVRKDKQRPTGGAV